MKRQRNQKVVKGDKFGMLTIIKELEPFVNNIRQYRMVLCICECGNKVNIRLASITCGQTKSCGCERVRFAKLLLDNTTHGLCRHPLYSIWEGMIQRCHNLNSPSSKRYGQIGVSVCKEWRDNFKVFYDWAIANGWKEGLQIDKDKLSETKPGKLYSPETCCFLTQKENMRHRAITIHVLYSGATYPLSEACEMVGLTYNLVSARMRLGFTFEQAVSEHYKPKIPDYTNRTKRLKERKMLLKEKTGL